MVNMKEIGLNELGRASGGMMFDILTGEWGRNCRERAERENAAAERREPFGGKPVGGMPGMEEDGMFFAAALGYRGRVTA